ncbi:MAG: TonB-dependent receptor [Pyrinomonadaceae bacterium]
MRKLSLIIAGMLLFNVALRTNASAQSATATLSGTVVDEQGAVVSGANVTVVDAAKSFERSVVTNNEGSFTVTQLSPSTYTVSVQGNGFATAQLPVVLNVNDQRALRIELRVAQVGETVDVTDATSLIDESPAVATIVDRQFVENQPLNGRSFQTLVELAPGVVIAPSNLPNPGQFSVNGQRTGSNYFTVDGVSANFGSTASVTLYETAGGGVPSYSALGSTASLASVDAVQEFSIQTSTYAPEFGRQPGAQVSLVTRSGTNEFHGSIFDYIRNDIFDANNFFANANGLPRPAIRQNDFGFTFGGPLLLPRFGEGGQALYNGRNRTFFFVSYEGVRLRQPFVTEPLQVPSLSARASATGALRDILNAFPLPTGPAFANDPTAAPYIGSFSNPSTLDATSFRIDHTANNRLSFFGRFNYAPSEDLQRARFCAASCVADLTYKTLTLTLGGTMVFSPRFTNDLRVNFSRSKVNQTYFIDDFGGATPPPASSLYPSFTTRDQGYIYIEVNTSGSNTLSDGLFSDNQQRQFNIVNNSSYTVGSHALKFGVDFRRLAPVSNSGSYKRAFLPDSIRALVNNTPTDAEIIAPDIILRPIYNNLSLFAQDTWRATDRLTLTYGLRYEVVPAPSEENGNLPPTVTGLDDPATLSLAPRGSRFYETTYNNFAPRVGLAYQLFPERGTIVRGGFGVFYDLGYNFTGSAFSTGIYPFARRVTLSDVTFTAPAFAAQPPSNNLNPPFPRVFAYEEGYKLPYTLQYNVAIEQAIGASNTISATYTGASGRRLGRVESLRRITPNFTRIDLVTNDASSTYNALQVQFQRRFSQGLQALASYTFAKSTDTASDESQNNFQTPSTRFDPEQDRGPSSFDVRHAFNAAVSYDIPTPFESGFGRRIFGGFGIDTIFRARTATPVNVVTGRDALGLGITTVSRPDLVPGQPLYIEDSTLAGGRRFNPAAFDAATPRAQARQGTLGRNVLRGFPLSQVDVSLRRQFGLTEQLKLQFRVDAFNVFNHPNFANPTGVVTSPNFGRATQMLGSGLAGLSPLYQIGGPRSFQLALKLQF